MNISIPKLLSMSKSWHLRTYSAPEPDQSSLPDGFLSSSEHGRSSASVSDTRGDPRIKETSQFSRSGKISAFVFCNVRRVFLRDAFKPHFLRNISSFIAALDEILHPRDLTIAF
ncbi:hypothetical protein Q8A67_005584 [Cirrhinus molitorella]|uniref:Uncharacterized protein n=1 Tax=Cirrhinus molitorella TaxID=172907 RepID=A0AA88QAX0_9TELE|nr:hypothetical protein Q8A67_005584 [Cirrhinus molitorella]